MNQTFKRGDKVVFIDAKQHQNDPQYYPPAGTDGVVIISDRLNVLVQWPIGSTSGYDLWWIASHWVESATHSQEK